MGPAEGRGLSGKLWSGVVSQRRLRVVSRLEKERLESPSPQRLYPSQPGCRLATPGLQVMGNMVDKGCANHVGNEGSGFLWSLLEEAHFS